MSPPKTLVCLGLGYVARFLTAQLLREGWDVVGTHRGPPPGPADPSAGTWLPFQGGDPSPELVDRLRSATCILSSIPPGDDGDPVVSLLAATWARQDAATVPEGGAAPGPSWIGYLSSTGVYGDREGGWVDESSPLVPTSGRARNRVEAEEGWRRLHREHDLPVHVFRLAGIYGPGRSALDAVRHGRAARIDKPGHAFSRIHVLDIVRVLRASMEHPRPGRVYNVCDDEPAPSSEVNTLAFRLLGQPVPPAIPFEEAELSPMARSFYRDNKRVRNDRIKDELGVQLLFPSYREGLAHLAQNA